MRDAATVRNPLLSLPAAKRLCGLEPETRAAMLLHVGKFTIGEENKAE